MKSYLLTLNLLFAFFTGYTQNWNLVMSNDTLVYEKESTFNDLYTVWVDSIHVSTTDTIYFMNRISPGEVIDTILYDSSCAYSRMHSQNVFVRELTKPQFCGATVSHIGNKWEINTVDRLFVIYPNVQIGDSWVCDSISGDSMKLISEDYKMLDVYGVVDSVKTFEYNAHTITLSQNYGLLVLPDLGSMYLEKFELVGVQNLKLGVVIPRAKDYFDYNVGDVFKRWVGHANSDGSDGYNFRREVVDKQRNGDTLIYTYKYAGRNVTGDIKYWPEMNPMLNAFPNTVAEVIPIFLDTALFDSGVFVTVQFGNNYGGGIRLENRNYQQGLCLMDSVWIDYQIDGPFCEYVIGVEPYVEGMNNGFETDHDFLRGYLKNGILHGDTTLGVLQIENEKHFKFYPNPAKESIQISTDKFFELLSFEVFDAQGKKVSFGEFHTSVSLDVDSFSKGLHFIIIRNQNGQILIRKKVLVS